MAPKRGVIDVQSPPSPPASNGFKNRPLSARSKATSKTKEQANVISKRPASARAGPTTATGAGASAARFLAPTRRISADPSETGLRAAGDGLRGKKNFARYGTQQDMTITHSEDVVEVNPNPVEELVFRPVRIKDRAKVVQIAGNHGLTENELQVVMELNEPANCKHLLLERLDETFSDAKVLVMWPEARRGRTRLPTILMVSTTSWIEEELSGAEASKSMFQNFTPNVVGHIFSGQLGALHLQLPGGFCSLPAHVSAFAQLRTFSKTISEVMSVENVERRLFVLRMLRRIFEIGMLRCTLTRATVETVALTEVFLEEPSIGFAIYDSFGSTCGLDDADHVGYRSSYGAPDMQKFVQEVTGLRMMPSEFLILFKKQTSLADDPLKLRIMKGPSHSQLCLDTVVHDSLGIVWVLNGSGVKNGQHVFTDITRWLVHALFLSTPPADTLKDIRHLHELIFTIASVHGTLECQFPRPPNDSSSRTRFMWGLAEALFECYSKYANFDPSKMEKPAHQILWVLFRHSIEMAASRMLQDVPEQKRLALMLALACATHILVQLGRQPEPLWLQKRREAWQSSTAQKLDDSIIPAMSPYLCLAGSEKGWPYDDVGGHVYSTAEDRIVLESYGEKSINLEGIEDVLGYWAGHYPRILLTGGPGSGKSQTARGLVTQISQMEIIKQDRDKIPLCVPLKNIAALCEEGVSEPLQEYISQSYDEESTTVLSWQEFVPAPSWPARSYHQTVVWEGKLLVLAGCLDDHTPLQDIWSLDCGSLAWEELPCPPWSARHSHQAVNFAGKLLVFGGMDAHGRPIRDIWESMDGGLNWQQLPCPNWPGRFGHRAVILNIARASGELVRDHLVIVGGRGTGDKVFGDVWASDNGGYLFHELEPPPFKPRYGHAMMVSGDKLLVLGGVNQANQKLSEVWAMTGQLWLGSLAAKKQVEVAGRGGGPELPSTKEERTKWEEYPNVPWSGRESHQICTFRGQIVICGGTGDDGLVTADAWASQDGGLCWKELPRSIWRPVASRCGHCIVGWKNFSVIILGGRDALHRPIRDVIIPRSLFMILEAFDEVGLQSQIVANYIDKIITSEPDHRLFITSRPSALVPLESMLKRWEFKKLRAKSLGDKDLAHLCETRLCDIVTERSKIRSMEQMLLKDQYRELVSNPMIAIMLLREFVHSSHVLGWYDVYEKSLEYSLVGFEDARRFDTAKVQDGSMEAAACELAFEIQSRGWRSFTSKWLLRQGMAESVETLVKNGQNDKLPLFFDVTGEEIQIRLVTMQEYLAAKHILKGLRSQGRLPSWFLKESVGSDAAIGCGSFFCALLARCHLDSRRFQELYDSFGCVLRNMARVGDHYAITSLAAKAPDRQLLLIAADKHGNQRTALHVAALHGRHDAVHALLEMAPDPEALNAAVDVKGYTALHYAAQHGGVKTCYELLHFAIDTWALLTIAEQSDRCYMPIHLAAQHGHDNEIRTMLQMVPSAVALATAGDEPGYTALHHAAQHGHQKVAHTLLEFCSPHRIVLLTAKNKYDRRTPLHLAADNGRGDVVRMLARLAADKTESMQMFSARDHMGQSALHLAAEKGYVDTIVALLECAPDVSLVLTARERLTGRTPLHVAADAGHGESVRAILQAAPDKQKVVAAVDKCGRYTPLHSAIEKGRAEAARALVELAPDREALLLLAERVAGQMPLHLVASMGSEEIAAALIDLAPDPIALLEKPDKAGGFTPLHLACEKGHKDVVQVFLRATPAQERSRLINTKLERWCNFTSMHLAALRGHEGTVEAVLQLAPDRNGPLNCRDRAGRTPAQVASDRGFQAVAALLA